MPKIEVLKEINIRQTKVVKKKIRKSYLKGFFGAIALTIVASTFAGVMNHQNFLNESLIKFVQLFSVVPGAAALYGKKALSEILTTGANSPEEKYNDLIFNCLSSV